MMFQFKNVQFAPPRPHNRFVKLGLDSFAVSDLAVSLLPLLVQLLSHLSQLLTEAPVTLNKVDDIDLILSRQCLLLTISDFLQKF